MLTTDCSCFFFFFKELIQNAEDAGAREVKFLHDKHSYGTEKLHSKSLAKFQVSLDSDFGITCGGGIILSVLAKNKGLRSLPLKLPLWILAVIIITVIALPRNRVQHFTPTTMPSLLQPTGRASECCLTVLKSKIP